MYSHVLFFVLLLVLLLVFAPDGYKQDVRVGKFEHKRIAVIGAGAAGSSAAYFSRQYLGEEVDIEIFEKQSDIGGRVRDKEFHNQTIELGGSIRHVTN